MRMPISTRAIIGTMMYMATTASLVTCSSEIESFWKVCQPLSLVNIPFLFSSVLLVLVLLFCVIGPVVDVDSVDVVSMFGHESASLPL